MKGYLDDKKFPRVDIEIVGLKKSTKISALIDTGFDGELKLSALDAGAIGLVIRTIASVTLGDGKTKRGAYVFDGHLKITKKETPIEILVSSDPECTIGTQLLEKLEIDFTNNKVNVTLKTNKN